MPQSPSDRASPEALFAQAVENFRAGELRNAEAIADRLCKLCPTDPGVWNLSGVVAKARRQFQQAEANWKKAIGLRPDVIEPRFNLALLCQETARTAEAIELYRAVLALNADHLQALNNLGGALELHGRLNEALACVDRILMIDPNHANAHKNRGLLLNKLGAFAEANAEIEKALDLDPHNLSYYFSLSTVRQFVPGDPYLSKLEALEPAAETLAPRDRIHLHFSLSKAYADIGDLERSFRQLIKGNAEKRGQIQYDEARELNLLWRTQTVFTRAAIEAAEAAKSQGCLSERPVFIVGMPRSGTTLIEQILASHPQVYGAGELDNFSDLLRAQCSAHQLPFEPEAFARLPSPALRQLGEQYVASLSVRGDNSLRVVDKNTMNFLYVGLIHQVLPQARIIHARRDAIDTCLSCFEKKFRGPLSFTYDLAELGRYWKAYDKLMSHWRSVLPEGAMFEVCYEELVSDHDVQVRRLLRYCGLDWDERCLSFHQTQRAVDTASAMQVRRPLYRSSVGRWAAFKPYLEPLLKELGRD